MVGSYFLLLLALLPPTSFAKSLGTLGDTFPIAEENLLAQIQSKANTNGATHLYYLTPEMLDPFPVEGLSTTQEPQTWYFDLGAPKNTTLSHREIINPNISVTDSAINPPTTVSLSQALLFYDADDVRQVKWAQQMDKALAGQTKLILVKGSVQSQMLLFGKPVYFDQGGILTDRFQLKHVPCIITQQDNRLKIQEVLPDAP